MGVSILIFCSRSCREVPLTIRLESSAKRMELKLWNIEPRSLMYNKKSNGPKIDPWGTPQVIYVISDLDPPKVQYCVLFVR